MKRIENSIYQESIESFEYEAEIKLSHKQKFALKNELERLVNKAMDSYWRYSQDAYRNSVKDFKRYYEL